jgi:hypothetical protein
MKAAFTLALTVVTTAALGAQGGPPPDVAARSKGADEVVVARVVDVTSRFDTNESGDQLIVSDVALQVEETLKGKPAATNFVTVEGGSVGDITLDVSDMPSMQKNDRAVLFLKHTPAGSHVPWGRGNGVLKLDETNHVEGSNATLEDVKAAIRNAR